MRTHSREWFTLHSLRVDIGYERLLAPVEEGRVDLTAMVSKIRPAALLSPGTVYNTAASNNRLISLGDALRVDEERALRRAAWEKIVFRMKDYFQRGEWR